MLKVSWPGTEFRMVDFIPMAWFKHSGMIGTQSHYIDGSNGYKSTIAYCSLIVEPDKAILDYGGDCEANNTKNNVDIGVAQIVFTDTKRIDIESIFWKEKGYPHFENVGTRFYLEEDDLALVEGNPKLVQHMRAERRPELAKRKKDGMLADKGHLVCELCDADYRLIYGDCAPACYEVHHDVPLAKRGIGVTTLDDLTILCANCHRAIHRTNPMVTVEAFRKRLGKI